MEELTPQQIQLDKDLQVVPTIKSLKNGQEQIIKELEDDREFNETEFAKGTKKFKELSTALNEVRSEVSDMKVQISDGFREQKRAFEKHILDGKEDEIRKLNKRLDARDQIKNGVIITLVGGIILWLLMEILKPTLQ